MTTLTIKDLARNEELDRDAMAGVRGGYALYPYYDFKLDLDFSKTAVVNASQELNQGQVANLGNGSAFFAGIDSHMKQKGSNNITVNQ